MLNKIGQVGALVAAQHYLSDALNEESEYGPSREPTLREVKAQGVRMLSNAHRDEAEMDLIVERYNVSAQIAAVTVRELHEQAAVLQKTTAYRHPLADIRAMMTAELADVKGPCMKYWDRKKGTIVVYLTRFISQRLVENAGVVKVPLIRHGRDTERKKREIRAAGIAPLDFDEIAIYLEEQEAEDEESGLSEYFKLVSRAVQEKLSDTLADSLPMYFFRLRKCRPVDWYRFRREMKVERFTQVAANRLAKNLAPLKLKPVKDTAPTAEVRERSIRAGFRLWYARTRKMNQSVPELPEHVMEDCIACVIRWRDTPRGKSE